MYSKNCSTSCLWLLHCPSSHTVRLSSQPGSTFDGFMVEARESTDSFDEGSTIWGTWVPDPSDANYHAVTCNRSNDSSVGPFEVSFSLLLNRKQGGGILSQKHH